VPHDSAGVALLNMEETIPLPPFPSLSVLRTSAMRDCICAYGPVYLVDIVLMDTPAKSLRAAPQLLIKSSLLLYTLYIS
jgi:hypothetical protein